MNRLTQWLIRHSPLVLLLRVQPEGLSPDGLRQSITDACRRLVAQSTGFRALPGADGPDDGIRIVLLSKPSQLRPGGRLVVPFLSTMYRPELGRSETVMGVVRIVDGSDPGNPRRGKRPWMRPGLRFRLSPVCA